MNRPTIPGTATLFLDDPPPSQADLHFRAFGFPVRVHPFFWLSGLFLGLQGEKTDPKVVLVWIAVLFVSILIHELGHAIVARWFGHRARIVLHGCGGLAIHDGPRLSTNQNILVSLAGPGAGFLLAGIVIAFLALNGHFHGFEWSLFPVKFSPFFDARGENLRFVNLAIIFLLYLNIYWGVINLFPVYPLDGGQVARYFLTARDPYQGLRTSLILSIIAAAILVVFALKRESIFMAVMFGVLGFGSYQSLQEHSGRGGRW